MAKLFVVCLPLFDGDLSFCAVAMSSAQHEKVAKALADPQRFALLESICKAGGKEVGCKELVAKSSVCQATISHHLKELMNAELIDGRRDGQCLMLSAKPVAVKQYVEHLSKRLLA